MAGLPKRVLDEYHVAERDSVLAEEIRKDLYLPAEVTASATVLLGGETAAGKQRRSWTKAAGRTIRCRKDCLRTKRARSFRAAAGDKAEALARTGI